MLSHPRILALITTLLLLASLLWPQPATAQNEEIIVLEIKGVITHSMVSYFERGINKAEDRGAQAVLIILDTPGGAVDATLEIVRLFRNAEIPVIVYVGPAGAQAASGGSIVTMAAHAAAMAPETVIGAAAVIDGSGGDLPETARMKATQDLQAVVRSLTDRRGPAVVSLAESMIDEAIAVNATEALEIGLIDVIATDETNALRELDGRTVTVGEQQITLQLTNARVTPEAMSPVEAALFWLSNPLIIGFLLTIAVPAILIELQSPGGYIAGAIGITCLVIGLYALGQLPANWLGLVFILLAFILLTLEIKTSTGLLGLLGTVSMIGGLLITFNSPSSPEFIRISTTGAIFITLPVASLFFILTTLVVKAQKAPALTGQQGLLGQIGYVRQTIEPRRPGSVFVRGEIWRAKADRIIEPDQEIIVKSMDGLTLKVTPVNHPAPLEDTTL
ncbi:MAG TPA: nodulation protein NfeD [Anaerolineae bacterium]|nr:nodulation protein NfeD [Anaerolineae bacterium]